MSFVEGINAGSVDIADPAFALCIGGIALLVSLLLAAPVLATALRLLRPDGSLGKLYGRLMATLHLRRRR